MLDPCRDLAIILFHAMIRKRQLRHSQTLCCDFVSVEFVEHDVCVCERERESQRARESQNVPRT